MSREMALDGDPRMRRSQPWEELCRKSFKQRTQQAKRLRGREEPACLRTPVRWNPGAPRTVVGDELGGVSSGSAFKAKQGVWIFSAVEAVGGIGTEERHDLTYVCKCQSGLDCVYVCGHRVWRKDTRQQG